MTAAEYIAAAIARSYLNRGEVLAQAQTEMLVRLSQQFRHYYAQAAESEDSVFAQVAILPFLTSPSRWEVPADCDTVHAIEQGDVLLVGGGGGGGYADDTNDSGGGGGGSVAHGTDGKNGGDGIVYIRYAI